MRLAKLLGSVGFNGIYNCVIGIKMVKHILSLNNLAKMQHVNRKQKEAKNGALRDITAQLSH